MKFNRSNILLGILGAAAAGVAIGMLVAPSKGTKLRSDLKDSANDLTRRLGKLLTKGKAKYDELSDMAYEQGNHIKRNAKGFVKDTGDAYNDYTEKLSDASNDLLNDVSKSYKKAKS